MDDSFVLRFESIVPKKEQPPTTKYPKGANSDLLREMRREMDKLRSTIREKTDRTLDRMVRRTDLPFTIRFLDA